MLGSPVLPPLASSATTLIASLVAAWFVPWLGMKFIMRRLLNSNKAPVYNYAGRPVVYGLGWVWIIWLVPVCALSFSYDGYLLLEFLFAAIPVVVAGFVFGELDDRRGARGSGGFKGHIKALLSGKLTTGMIKLVGITLASLLSAYLLRADGFHEWSQVEPRYMWHLPALIILSGAASALTANFVNLCDLRPVRASKMYLLLVLFAFFIGVGKLVVSLNSDQWFTQVILLMCLVGPAVAIWRYDAGERAMLGDAGANPMGALAGLYFACVLDWMGLIIYVLIMFALNLISEKISYSALIERSSWLKALDQWGRPPQQ